VTTRTERDDLGLAVPVPARVERVVSLVPSLTEAVATSAPALLVGATDWCTHPGDLGVARVRGTKNPDVDAVVGLAPDLVIANAEENREPDLAALRAAGLAVWVTAPTTVPAALDSLDRLLRLGCRLTRPSWLEEADAVWQAVTDTGLKLGLHPLPVWDQDGTARGFKLRDIMAASALGFPLDMMHTLYDMMAGGVFDRFPRMPTMILEAGCGWIPSMFERWEEHMKMFGKVKAPDWKSKPMDIFLRQMMVTVEAGEEIDINIALQYLPATHLALASDWPHYDGTPDLIDGFNKATHGVKDEDVRLLATGTLERWFPSH